MQQRLRSCGFLCRTFIKLGSYDASRSGCLHSCTGVQEVRTHRMFRRSNAPVWKAHPWQAQLRRWPREGIREERFGHAFDAAFIICNKRIFSHAITKYTLNSQIGSAFPPTLIHTFELLSTQTFQVGITRILALVELSAQPQIVSLGPGKSVAALMPPLPLSMGPQFGILEHDFWVRDDLSWRCLP